MRELNQRRVSEMSSGSKILWFCRWKQTRPVIHFAPSGRQRDFYSSPTATNKIPKEVNPQEFTASAGAPQLGQVIPKESKRIKVNCQLWSPWKFWPFTHLWSPNIFQGAPCKMRVQNLNGKWGEGHFFSLLKTPFPKLKPPLHSETLLLTGVCPVRC